MKDQRTLDAKKIALTKRILAINDPKKLDAINDAVESDGFIQFTEKEIAELETIRDGMANGSIAGRPWEVVRKELFGRKR